VTTNPRFLNLDEMPVTETDIAIQHQNTRHVMEVLTVDAFVEQQKRAQEHEELIAKALAQAEDDSVTEEEAKSTELRAVEVVRDAVQSFFPTLPVGELTVNKLFLIFGWLNEMSAKTNADGAEGTRDAEGNA
jgi:hypothetical protein